MELDNILNRFSRIEVLLTCERLDPCSTLPTKGCNLVVVSCECVSNHRDVLSTSTNNYQFWPKEYATFLRMPAKQHVELIEFTKKKLNIAVNILHICMIKTGLSLTD